MPELPEVETVARDLTEHLVGRVIDAARVYHEGILLETTVQQIELTLPGKTVTDVGRRGKNLIIRLSGGAVLLVHLGMTGQLFVCEADVELADHTHFVAELSSGRRLIFRDVRRFGHIELLIDARPEESVTLRNVGLDAMSEEFTPEYLAKILEGRKPLLKSALLDQSRLAGLGNIYVCEVLFRAKIDPKTRCRELSEADLQRLHHAIREVLAESIAAEGTTISDYVTGRGVPGNFQKRLAVYGRADETCRCCDCEHTIVRIVQSNRSTFYCPGCQRGSCEQE